MKLINKLKYLFLPSALILHVALIFMRGYFLSAEFTFNPYLISRGFLPYRDIIDQHFPSPLLGPFSLPSFLTTNPWPLLGLFLATLCLTDIFLYATLIRFKVKQPLVWLVLFIVSSVYFSGYVLWIETFVNLSLSIWFFLSFSKNNLRRFISGFLLSQIILMRPTIGLALICVLFSFSEISLALILGGLIGLGIPAFFLFKNHLFPDFYRVAIKFNREVYPYAARVFPGKREVLFILAWLTPVLFMIIKNKKYLYLATLIGLLLLAYPRFGYEHLQPFFLVGVVIWARLSNRPGIPAYLFIIIFFSLNLISAIRHPYGNYYLNREVQASIQPIRNLPGVSVYFLGVPDILYQLSGKMPPNYTYVPSLPWYLEEKDYQDKIITALKLDHPPVLIDLQAEVDGQNIASSSGSVLEYIKMNYKEGENIGRFQLFLPKL